jgi:acyl-coenzyme A synthetase/AMP-(fatty) acid ligase
MIGETRSPSSTREMRCVHGCSRLSGWSASRPQVGVTKTYTYRQVLHEVCRVANVLKSFGVRKGDTVAM